MMYKIDFCSDCITFINKVAYRKDNIDILFTGKCQLDTDDENKVIDEYISGQIANRTIFNDTGEISSESFFYENGLKKMILYWENGHKKFENHFKDGKLSGETTLYREDGKPLSCTNYVNGIKSGLEIIYNKTGEIVEKRFY